MYYLFKVVSVTLIKKKSKKNKIVSVTTMESRVFYDKPSGRFELGEQ